MPDQIDTQELLERHFETAFTAPGGVKKLRDLILTLAMRGKLVPQDPNDPPASELLKEIEAEKLRLIHEKNVKASKAPSHINPMEFPYALPRGWKWARLESLVSKIGSGSTPRGGKSAYVASGIPFLRSQNIWNHGLKLIDVAYIPPQTHDRMKATAVKAKDILLNITGASLGRAALVPNNFEEGNVSQHVTIIRCIQPEQRRYLHYYFLSPFCQRMIWARQVGMAREGLSKKVLEQFEIPIPSLPEQHRIVAKVDELMARCDELERLRAEREQKRLSVHKAAVKRLLEAGNKEAHANAWQFLTQHFGKLYTVKENVAELRKAILQLAVMGKLVPQDPDDPPASELLNEIEVERQKLIKEKKIKKLKQIPPIDKHTSNEIPESWKWAKFQDLIISIRYGTSKKCSYDGGSVPVLRIPNISNGKISIDDLKSADLNDKESNDLSLQKGDLLLIRSNGSESLVGRTAVVCCAAEGFSYAGYLLRVRVLLQFVDPHFLKRLFDSPMIRAAIEGPIRTTSGVKNINSTEISQLGIPVPPVEEQHRIVAKVDELMTLCDKLDQLIEASTTKQTQLLDSVMARIY